MKLIAVVGITQSGKTTTVEAIIRELRSRGHSVASVKEIHYEKFAIDTIGTNTHRHRIAGSELVSALGMNETDILYPRRLPIQELISKYENKFDFLVMEGVADANVPLILTAHNTAELDERWTDYVIAVSGRISAQIDSYRNVPAIDATADIKSLVDLILQKTYDRLPAFPPECCGSCGFSCADLGAAIIQGKAKRSDCVADKGVELTVNGERIKMVPFVQLILRNAVMGVVSTLEGYKKGADIEINLKDID